MILEGKDLFSYSLRLLKDPHVEPILLSVHCFFCLYLVFFECFEQIFEVQGYGVFGSARNLILR